MPAVRARVAEIKRQVEAGTYRIDPALVAEAMIDRKRTRNNGVTEEQMQAIRALDYEGVGEGRIAAETCVSQATVSKVIRNHERPPVYHRARR